MANHYVRASFVLDVTADEAELIVKAFDAAGLLDGTPAAAEIEAGYVGLGQAFAAAFPPGDDDPFASFRDLFDDGDYPTFGCEIDGSELAGGGVRLWFGGDQVGIDALPRLFAKVAPSALPFAFEYSFDCDRLRIGEFGGGIAIATAEGADWITTRSLVEDVLAPSPPLRRFVLATRDPATGLAFWNREAGFGALEAATVFGEAETRAFDTGVVDRPAAWLALPAARS